MRCKQAERSLDKLSELNSTKQIFHIPSLILQLMIEGAITISFIRNDTASVVDAAEKVPILLKNE
jgi:hypothetical protein